MNVTSLKTGIQYTTQVLQSGKVNASLQILDRFHRKSQWGACFCDPQSFYTVTIYKVDKCIMQKSLKIY